MERTQAQYEHIAHVFPKSTTAPEAAASDELIPRLSDRFRSNPPDPLHGRSWFQSWHPPDVVASHIVEARIGVAQ